ncbi:MAG: Spo0E like sporulation regulatory protein [Tepidanaerobacteraceae bacterium]|nr:Spo0E like sporulation regulatory protein [Tepidanaerobacteraceae bacterium]
MLRSLSREIYNLRIELYKTLDVEENINSQRVYLLSLKLDKLIYEYYCFNKAQKMAEANPGC